MLITILATIACVLALLLVVTAKHYRTAERACSCGAFEPLSPLALIDHVTQKPARFATKWTDDDFVKFSRRYHTLHSDEI